MFSRKHTGIIIIAIIVLLGIGAAGWLVTKSSKAEGPYGASIMTSAGELRLMHDRGMTTLTGELARSTPCVNWEVSVSRSEYVELDIANADTSETCVQLIATPEPISVDISNTDLDTVYRVTLAGELIWSGALGLAAIPSAPTEGSAE